MTKPEAKKVTVVETDPARAKEANKPKESLVDAISGTLTSIFKIQDLRSAQKALSEAQELKNQGEKSKAKDLVVSVFDRLKEIGYEKETLVKKDVIKKLVQDGEYELLAEVIAEERKEFKKAGDSGVEKQASDDAEQIELRLRAAAKDKETLQKEAKREMEEAQKSSKLKGNIVGTPSLRKLEQLPKKLTTEISEKARKLAVTEAKLVEQVETEIGEMVETLGGELKKKERESLEKEWGSIQLERQLGGQAEISLKDVEETRSKLKDFWQELGQKQELVVNEAKKKVLKARASTGRTATAAEKAIGNLSGSEKILQRRLVVAAREVAGVLEGVEEKLKLGISFKQVCRDLKPEEIRVVWKWAASVDKKPGQDGYDEILSAISDQMQSSPDVWRAQLRFLDALGEGYDEQLLQGMEQEARAMGYKDVEDIGRRMRAIDEPLMRDPVTGRPTMGREPGVSDFNQSGVQFLRGRSEAPWLDEWMQIQTQEQMEAFQDRQRSLYRAEMMNVSFEALMDDEAVSDRFKELLDVESFEKGQVARLKDEFRNNAEIRAEFGRLWLQEMFYAQRLIAYEGVFQGAHYDARVTRYNTLMSIMDISTEQKGVAKFQGGMFNMVDVQQNSYLSEEGLEGLVKPWLSQGPDFRLEHDLKLYRENIYAFNREGKRVSIGDISLYDVVHKLKMRVENHDERVAMEMPDGIERHYGTMMVRHSEDAMRTRNRKVVFFSLMDDLGVDFSNVDQAQKDMVYNMYQSYLDEGINYMAMKKQLHQAVGNASFKPGEYAMCQGLPEMLYKADPFLVMDYFRIYSVGGASKSAFVFGDSGMRDQFVMAPNDYGQHLLELERNNLGAPGILETFFGGRTDETTKSHAKWFAETMNKSIFHYGYHDHERKVTMSTRIGSSKEKKSGTRRPDAEIIDLLKKAKPPAGFVEAIDWGTKDNPGVFAKIVVDPKLVDKLTRATVTPQEREKISRGNLTDTEKNGLLRRLLTTEEAANLSDAKKQDILNRALTAQGKWDVFVNRFGEDYLNMQSPGAKRVEHMSKYGLTQHFTWYKNYLSWQLTPVNNTKAIDMFTPLMAVNSGIGQYVGENYLEFQQWANEKLGRVEAGGKGTMRVKKDKKTGQIKFDTSYGRMGKGDSEWPGVDDEEIKNNKGWTDPIQNTSVFGSEGVAGYEDELAMKNVAEDMHRAGILTEEAFRHWYKNDFMKSFAWQDKRGVLLNLWKWATLDVPFEYMGNVWFGIPGHMLKEALWEPTEKQLHNMWKYFSGGGGH